MLIHINRERFQSILNQSFPMPVMLPDDPHIRTGNSKDEETDYHLLDEEHGQCAICGTDEISITASTPVELEMHKIEQQMLEVD